VNLTLLPTQTVMMKRWMTEVLLDVTSEVLEAACEEVVARAREKGGTVTIATIETGGLPINYFSTLSFSLCPKQVILPLR